MTGPDAAKARSEVLADFTAAAPLLEDSLRTWMRSHLIPPREIIVARKTDGNNTEQFWLITDHNGSDDASFRLIYDDLSRRYGLECTIQNNVSFFAGFRSSLVEAVTDMRGANLGATK